MVLAIGALLPHQNGMNAQKQAILAFQAGQADQGIGLLTAAAEGGDAACWIELGFLYLKGQTVPRNLRRSRDCFARAAALGEPKGSQIHRAMVANGTGGPSDMQAAIALLADAACIEPGAASQLNLLQAMNIDESGDPLSPPQPSMLSEQPWIGTFPALFTPAECAYLTATAEPAFGAASVGDRATGQQGYSAVRTCEVAVFPWVAEDPVVHALNRRIAAASNSAVECGEPLQILRYAPGQEFKPHVDCTASTDNQRVMTMLVYLNEDYGGGETEFLSSGLRVKGRTGDGLLFRNADLKTGQPDPASRHAGLPVTSGKKLVASRWIRQKPYGPARQ